ncbi:MAG: ribonuclease R [Lactobacillaceae bacterium]|jgi:ribonuclease R|nr:ribonuclease R [Lactobacillaceae bacterium]
MSEENQAQIKLQEFEKYSGRFVANEKGFGFVKTEEGLPDIFIGGNNTMLAMTGDTVLAQVIRIGKEGKEAEGKVLEITNRAAQNIVGVFHVGSADSQTPEGKKVIGELEFLDKKLSSFRYLITDQGVIPNDRDSIVATTSKFPNKNFPNRLTGMATSIIGRSDAPGIDILEIVTALKIPNIQPPEVEDEVANIPNSVDVDEALKNGYEDLRDQQIITMDSADTKDIDDAVIAYKMSNGNYHLGVHIADVSSYVISGSAIDKEAYNRGTSVYLTDRVIPMTPPAISNGIASLNPNVDRLAMSIEMEINADGVVVNHRIHKSIIKSKQRVTYADYNKFLAHDPEISKRYTDFADNFNALYEVHQILYAMRLKRGAIEFDTPEAKIIVDEKGKAVDIQVINRGIGERMIESTALVANETVAMHYDKLKVPFLYRIHEVPEGDKVTNFFQFMTAIGHPIMADPKNLKPIDFQNALKEVAGAPEEIMVRTMMLRATKQAKYSPEPIGHFGIGAQYYTHFTSPIRRFPDTTVHRLIKFYDENGTGEDAVAKVKELFDLEQIGIDTSEKERRAIDAERQTNDMKMAEYMESHIGEEFDGLINSALKFGIFVSLENTVEGLVHISNMSDDDYWFDESRASLIGRNKHHIYTIGQKVKVKVIKASKEERKIDFQLVNPENAPITNIPVPVEEKRRRDYRQNGQREKKYNRQNDRKGKMESTGQYKLRKGRR